MCGWLITKYAEKYKLKPEIVYGICQKESNFNPLAIRYEPDFKYHVNFYPVGCSKATEDILQKFSFGIMQIMGCVLRELGYDKVLTDILTDLECQLDYSCKHLSKKISKYGEFDGIASYNSGSPVKTSTGLLVNQKYVTDVLKYAKEYTDERA